MGLDALGWLVALRGPLSAKLPAGQLDRPRAKGCGHELREHRRTQTGQTKTEGQKERADEKEKEHEKRLDFRIGLLTTCQGQTRKRK